jgi:single-stranded DNA-binding protein
VSSVRKRSALVAPEEWGIGCVWCVHATALRRWKCWPDGRVRWPCGVYRAGAQKETAVSVNRVILVGEVGQYGPNITWTDGGKPQTSLTLVCEEAGRDGTVFKTFVPVLIVGAQAEHFAEILEPGEMCLVEGKLAFKAGKTKESGKMSVVTYHVERLHAIPVTSPGGASLTSSRRSPSPTAGLGVNSCHRRGIMSHDDAPISA